MFQGTWGPLQHHYLENMNDKLKASNKRIIVYEELHDEDINVSDNGTAVYFIFYFY